MRILIPLLLLFPTLGLLAQTDSTVVTNQSADSATLIPFVAYWAKGDVYKFKVDKIDIRTQDQEETKNDTSSFIGRFEVIDSTDVSYTIKWSFDTPPKIDPKQIDDIQEVMSRIDIFDHLIYTTDELGAFQRVENMDQLINMIDETINVLTEKPPFSELPPEKFSQAVSLLQGMKNPDWIMGTMFDYIQLLHYPYGLEYNILDTIVYDEELPNMFGGSKINATNRLYIDSVDVADDFVHLKQYTNVDEDQSIKVLEEIFEQLSTEKVFIKSLLEEAVFDVYNDNDYYYYYYPGIPIYIDYFRKIIFSNSKNETTRIIQTKIEWVD